jgi:hypothetical protein
VRAPAVPFRLLRSPILAIALTIVVTAPCVAQVAVPGSSGTPIGWLSANVGGQVTTTDFDDSVTFPSPYAEDGTYTARYKVPSAVAIDVGGAVRIWRHFYAGAAVTYLSAKDDAEVSAQYPHPFFKNKHRPVSGTAAGMQRDETAVHVQAAWLVPVSPRLHLALFGGPSFFSVKQDVVTGVRVTETYPFDEAAFAGVSQERSSESAIGFNVGVDSMFMFTRHVGAGGLARFSRATVDLTTGNQSRVSVDVGGLIVSAGLRVAF